MAQQQEITAEVNQADIAFLKRVAKAQPKLLRRAWAGTTSHITNKMRKAVRIGGGKDGVDTFAPRNTTIFRWRADRPWGGKMGGNSLKKLIARKVTGDFSALIGLNSGMMGDAAVEFGETFQTAEVRPWTKDERYYMHRYLGLKEIPYATKARPARPFVEPLKDSLRGWLASETRKRVTKIIQKEMAKRKAKRK